MKKLFLLPLILLLAACDGESVSLEKNPHVLGVLELTGIQHDGTLKDMVEKTQDQWLREKHKERWDIGFEKFPKKKEALMAHFRALKYTDTIKPSQKTYDYAIVNGCTVSRYRMRLRSLIDAWDRGVRFKKLIILGGARPLSPKVEPESVLYDETNPDIKFKKGWEKPDISLKTEMDMMRYIYETAEIPESLRAVPTVYVDTPLIKRASGTLDRPRTPDTVDKWIQDHSPQKGSTCLAISCQPYVGYQHVTLETYLTKVGLKVETIGNKASPKTLIAVYLDSLGRHLYQENNRRAE